MTESRWTRIGLRVATGVVLAFLYLPLVILIIYAFNPSRLQAWPPAASRSTGSARRRPIRGSARRS